MFGMHCPFLCHSFKSQDAVGALHGKMFGFEIREI